MKKIMLLLGLCLVASHVTAHECLIINQTGSPLYVDGQETSQSFIYGLNDGEEETIDVDQLCSVSVDGYAKENNSWRPTSAGTYVVTVEELPGQLPRVRIDQIE